MLLSSLYKSEIHKTHLHSIPFYQSFLEKCQNDKIKLVKSYSMFTYLVLALALTEEVVERAVVTVDCSFGVIEPALEIPDEDVEFVELKLPLKLIFE